MTTLLLRLSAPMQAWGTQSNFSNRDTGREPSKSGVIGLLCAALGRPRNAPVDDLAALRMGVRVDQEGMIRKDYHTAGKGGYYKIDGKIESGSLIVTERYYLHDAKFLVGLEGDTDLLTTVQAALMQPRWLLFLGRKACIPSERIWLPDGLQDAPLLAALRNYPWLGRGDAPSRPLRILIEDDAGAMFRNDQPISFSARRFVPRRTMHHSLSLSDDRDEG